MGAHKGGRLRRRRGKRDDGAGASGDEWAGWVPGPDGPRWVPGPDGRAWVPAAPTGPPVGAGMPPQPVAHQSMPQHTGAHQTAAHRTVSPQPGPPQQPDAPGPLTGLSRPPLSGWEENPESAAAHRAGPVAAVRGTVRLEQVVVGEPSPSAPSRPTKQIYRSVPFRPDTVIDGWSTTSATVRATSLRGHQHRFNGTPRQDDVAVHAAPSGRIVAVVADGVSAALHSHIGAGTATTAASQWLLARAAGIGAEVDWTALVRAVSWEMTERARGVLGPDVTAEQVELNLATTMVAAVMDPDPDGVLHAQLIGIGDSSAWVLRAGEFLPLLGGKAVDAAGISSSAVAGLPRVPAQIAVEYVTVRPGEVLLLGSDGVGDPLAAGRGGVGDLLRSVLTPTVPSLTEFAHAVDFSRETFDDDRTLVAVWPTPIGRPIPSRTGTDR